MASSSTTVPLGAELAIKVAGALSGEGEGRAGKQLGHLACTACFAANSCPGE